MAESAPSSHGTRKGTTRWGERIYSGLQQGARGTQGWAPEEMGTSTSYAGKPITS